MPKHAVATALALCCAASLTAAASAPSAARTTSPQAANPARADALQRSGRPVLVDCFWHPKVRPSAFILACGDGNSRLASLHWSRWSPKSAKAEGVNFVNDCKPYCAAGTFHSYRVVVRLDRAQPWKKHPKLQHYSRMTLVYPDGRPDKFPKTVTYPLWN
jgi:hypothetical protein